MIALYLLECMCYMFYIYMLCLLFITLKPNKILLSLAFIYCFFSSWYIIKGCRSFLVTNTYIKTIILLIYSLFCLSVCLVIHYFWKNKFIKLAILGLPFGYFFQIRIFEYIFECDNYHVITSPLRLI